MDSSEIDERVAALIDLLKTKDVETIKLKGEEICDAASDDEPWFEPEQMVQMMNIWMDACIAKLDEEALNVTAKALRWAKVEEDSLHPGLAETLRKLAKALDCPTPEFLEYMWMCRAASMKLEGDTEVLQPLIDIIKHKNIEKVHDGMETLSCRLAISSDLEDEELAARMVVFVDLVKHVAAELPTHKPGDMALSNRLAFQCKCLTNLMTGAMTFCATLVMDAASFPKAAAAVAAPTQVMALQDALKAVKPKPKEQELKQAVQGLVEMCPSLLQYMPAPAAGAASLSDPKEDAKTYLKGLTDAKDSLTVNNLLKLMKGTTDSGATDIILGKECLEAIIKAIDRVKKAEHDELWQTLPKFLLWAIETRPAVLDPVADKMAEFITSGPPVFMQPKTCIDAATERSPELARKIWGKMSAWKSTLQKTKGSPTFDGAVYAVLSSMESMPRVLEGNQLQEYCQVSMEFAKMGKGTTIDDAAKCVALIGIRGVVTKDKEKVPKDVLAWVQSCKDGDGSAQQQAERFMDVYEGRSLEGAYSQIAEANERFKASCGDMEQLKAYVDQNVADLKDFVGTITKKIPMPCQFSSEPRYVAKMAMLLHFKCEAGPKTRLCALPADTATFTTETLEWNRWLKLGMSAAKLGKSVLSGDVVADVSGTVDQVKEIFQTYTKKDDAAFLTYISEPFLTSEEQDKLLNQLREGGFFKRFAYDAQTGNWLCSNCHLVYQKAGRDRSPAALEAAATAVEKEGSILLGGNEAMIADNSSAQTEKKILDTGAQAGGGFCLFCCSGNGMTSDAEVVMPLRD
mmetsp:Transcript_6441/g.15639  ORF Transcript_6441/g.15639 Transcript_6441/m.15639 type:complete len:799 (-) Transcript_6441:9-2405(-)